MATPERDVVTFRVTEEAISLFARLTGDASPLHVDSEFARRSRFRSVVSHGMLPILSLSAIPSGGRYVPEKVSGRFLNPVFPGDRLSTALIWNESRSSATYEIRNPDTERLVTSGRIVFADDTQPSVWPAGSDYADMVDAPLAIRDIEYGQVSRGDAASLAFKISDGVVLAGRDLLRSLHLEPSHGFLRRLLTVVAHSTLVGMRLPGRWATLTDFDIVLDKNGADDEDYDLHGQVSFVSPTVRILKLSTRVCGPEGETATGALSVTIREPPTIMTSFESMKERVQEAGLQGKTAIVTGGGRGLGETIAKVLAIHGAFVVVNYSQSREAAEQVVQEISQGGGRALALQADVRSESDVKTMVDVAVEQGGGVDILVNNAVGDYTAIPFNELTWNDVGAELEVTIRGALHCCQAVIPSMIKRGGGRIINVCSTAVDDPPPNQTKYVIAKAGLLGLTRSLAVELAPRQILVNAVEPGLMTTDLTNDLPKMVIESQKARNPMGRLADPEDVARTVLYLASQWASFTTGQRIPVTGGAPPFL